MAADERLSRWWDSLDGDIRAEAQEARRRGRLTARLRKSLKDAGVPVGPVGAPMSDDVTEFLKMRH